MKSLLEKPESTAAGVLARDEEESAPRPLAPARWDWREVRRVLVVRLRSIGDTVLATASLDALRRFLVAPSEQFLRQRLGLRLPEVERADDDIEPLDAPSRGLERHRLQHAVFDALLAGEAEDAMHARLRAQGLLPSGALGRRALADLLAEVQPYAARFVA